MKTTKENLGLWSGLLALTIVLGLTASASAQITIRIPEISRVKKTKPEQPKQGSTDDTPAGDINTNPEAPPDYDANLKVNDLAIATSQGEMLEPVRIVARSGGAYKTARLEPPHHTEWYSANSVYPYFDKQEFYKIRDQYWHFVTPYIECYSKKHKLDFAKVAGNGFPATSYSNASEMRQALQAQQPKLAELESLLKSKLKARPNTFFKYNYNPAVLEEIATRRDEYLQCAVGAKEALRFSESGWLRTHLENIAAKQKEVDEYNPNEKIRLVSPTTYDYLLFAVSPRARDKWLKDAKALDFKSKVDPALEALAASVAKKLPIYIPNAANFAFRNPLEEKMMKGTLDNLATLKIHKIGLAQNSWLISKNNLGLPTARYKQGYIWVRDTADDHLYCRLYQVNIIQDYAGGGTYGASYAKFLDDTLFGCPTTGR